MKVASLVMLAALLACPLPIEAVNVTTNAGCSSTQSGITSTIDFGPSGSPAATDPAGHATYSTPFFNQGTGVDCAPASYLGLTTGNTTTITFDQPIDYFGLAWDSKDSNNVIEFFDGATLLASFSGADSPIADTFEANYVNFFAEPGEEFTSIVLSAGGCCFETDNHSYRLAATVVSQPPTMLMLALGLLSGLLGAVRRASSPR
jgi:hypothetical protein